jgi:hypothetical protein
VHPRPLQAFADIALWTADRSQERPTRTSRFRHHEREGPRRKGGNVGRGRSRLTRRRQLVSQRLDIGGPAARRRPTLVPRRCATGISAPVEPSRAAASTDERLLQVSTPTFAPPLRQASQKTDTFQWLVLTINVRHHIPHPAPPRQ